MRHFRKFTHASPGFSDGLEQFQHWYRDRTVYLITSRCRDRYRAFELEEAKAVFWNRFDHYTDQYGFVPWITSLLDSHYHTLGFLRSGENLGPMMQRLHGSVAKLVNDLLPARRVPFWRERGRRDYFDGCIRDEVPCRRAYMYVLRQSVRHGICRDWRAYPHTHISVELERGLKRARELNAFMSGVRYKRYER
jgi:hypothetical protein